MNTLVSTLVQESYTYLTFVAESSIAAFVFHGIEMAVALYVVTVIDTYSGKVVSFLSNFGLDLSALVAQLKNYITIIGVIFGLLAGQDAMNWTLSKLGTTASKYPVI